MGVFVGTSGADLAAAVSAGVPAIRYLRAGGGEPMEPRWTGWFAALSPLGRRLP